MFIPLERIDAHARSLAGGKAYNCARLRQAGFPVPDGLVIPADSADAEIRRLADDAWFAGVPMEMPFAVRERDAAAENRRRVRLDASGGRVMR